MSDLSQSIQRFVIRSPSCKGWETRENNKQIGGNHYKSKDIQPWDYIAAHDMDFFEGNIIKYVTRWKDKGGVEDLKKAQHYLNKLIELQNEQTN